VANSSKKGRSAKSHLRRKVNDAKILAFPLGTPVPDEMLSSEAKDRISDVVKKAAAGGRTTIMSRGYAIAIVGPVEDIPEAERTEAMHLPTTEIKSGQTSIKGIVARSDWAVLTIHGHARAALYRPTVRRHPAQTEDKLDRLIDLLEATQVIERFAGVVHERIAQSLDLLEKLEREQAIMLRAQYAALKKS
jgi:antitoxin (DNA-binding transcriptional repressor) of toxin-antitoxin stability system